MKSNLETVMDYVFVHEGGYAERDSEPGGAVNMGISFAAFTDWWSKAGRSRKPTFADLKALSREDAEEIYRAWFFAPIHFDVLPFGVDYAFVDLAVNSGVGGATRAVRRKLGFPPGRMDPKFLWAFKDREPHGMIDDICDARIGLMMQSKKWPRFQANWTRRVDAVRERAHRMADKGAA